ncbi:MAG: heavy metal translocating P-type ATPase [Verrucomicrobiota bacterium]|jgi:heavy metal translocating P-type ATPase
MKYRKSTVIAVFALAAIAVHLMMRFGWHAGPGPSQGILLAALILGGAPLIGDLLKKAVKGEFGSDLLAGISIVVSVALGQYLAGTIVVLMLSGGEVLETYAVKNASSVLRALASRMPSVAHRQRDGKLEDIPVDQIRLGDTLAIFPHEICPVDGVVASGHGRMDESFLTGEPFEISKARGSAVISGAVNGESALTITATKLAVDSRYAKITEVMRASEQNRPRLRRLGDQLGAWYTPFSVTVALLAWGLSGDPIRFLAVLVVATPCPLLIAIPVAIIGSISLAARHGIVVKNPIVLEQVDRCRTVIFDKTGTLTYGEPRLAEQLAGPGVSGEKLLAEVASLELYSRHPLARAILAAAKEKHLALQEVAEVAEAPGQGLAGTVGGERIEITSRRKALAQPVAGLEHLPPPGEGLECVVFVNKKYAASYRFHDSPRADGLPFIKHLGPKHQFNRIMILSGDRDAEVRYLAAQLGISEIQSEKTPEEKLAIVRHENTQAKTLYVGDGINDAPAMMAATVGLAVGQNCDVTAEAAGAIVMEGELKKIDEFMHISRRMRSIALQSVLGGMILSMGGMLLAAGGLLAPVAGAIFQEIIDVVSITNALRAALPPAEMSDF